jgi:pimeloyl-ACP methyl ester carboxylesterase
MTEAIQSKLVNLQGGVVELAIHGHGSPLIVLDSGSGDDWSSWSSIFPALAQRSRTLAYSRPGYGRSSVVQTPRDPWTQAQELRQLLRELGEQPPYLLVGHSRGGLIVQIYAALYPEETAGLVLVDPRHPELTERMQRDIPQDARTRASLMTQATGVAKEELESLEDPNRRRFPGDLTLYRGPIVVLGAWQLDQLGIYKQLRRYQRRLIRETAAFYPQSVLREAPCGHYIHVEQPGLVIEAIDAVLTQVRR